MKILREGVVVALALALAGCGSSNGGPGTPEGSGGASPSGSGGGTPAGSGGSGSGGNVASTGGTTPVGTGGAPAGTGGAAGPGTGGATATTGGASGTAGAAGTVATSTGGAAGASAGGGKGGGTGGGTAGGAPGSAGGFGGTEYDPGTDGDGEFNILPPYVNQPPGLTVNPNIPHGTTSAPMNFTSKTIYPGRSFPIQIYVPAQYTKERAAALMVTQDGRQWVGRFPIIYDNLIAAGKAPITINLFIPASTPADRSDEYDTVSGKYGDFIMQEVLPWVKGMGYNITDDPAGRAATGNSSGGIAAFSIAWFKPESFHRVFTSSGTFRNIGGKGGDMYPMTVMAAPPSPLRVFLSSSEGDMPGWLDANRAMSNALMAKGNHVRFIWGDSSIPHGGGAMLNGDLPFAFEWLWRGYKQP